MNIFSFFGEVKTELSKVVWPTRAQTIQYTLMVIVISVLVAVILGAADLGLLKLFEKLISR